MTIVFCADRGILAALHVAARSVLESFRGAPHFVILTDELDDADIGLLRATLDETGRKYSLDCRRIDGKPLEGFPKLAGRHSTYFRLLIPDVIEDRSCLYLDADILCRCDLSVLSEIDLAGKPVALVPEAPIESCPDRQVQALLGATARGQYYNAGVSLIDCHLWRSEDLKSRCFDFIAEHRPAYWDQSALNYVLHGRIAELPGCCNRHSNVRANWPLFRRPHNGSGQLIHFVDFPKPWSFLGRQIHPLGKLWWQAYGTTAHAATRREKPRVMEWSARTKAGYQKCLKDKLLFALYCRGWFIPKGVPKGNGSRSQ